MANFDELLDMVMLENAEMDFGVLDKATTKIKDLKKRF